MAPQELQPGVLPSTGGSATFGLLATPPRRPDEGARRRHSASVPRPFITATAAHA